MKHKPKFVYVAESGADGHILTDANGSPLMDTNKDELKDAANDQHARSLVRIVRFVRDKEVR